MRTGWDDGYSIQLFPGHSWHWLSLTIRSAHQRPLPSHVEARGCQRRGDLAGRCPLAGHSGSISPGRGEAWLSLESPGARSSLGPSPGVPPRLLRPCGGLHPGAGEGGLGDRRCEVTGAFLAAWAGLLAGRGLCRAAPSDSRAGRACAESSGECEAGSGQKCSHRPPRGHSGESLCMGLGSSGQWKACGLAADSRTNS